MEFIVSCTCVRELLTTCQAELNIGPIFGGQKDSRFVVAPNGIQIGSLWTTYCPECGTAIKIEVAK